MDIFISYSSDEAGLAEQMVYRLRGEGHDVFFDRHSLPPGEAYDKRIRTAIEGCDLFVFLLSKAAVSAGSYALSELAIARERWAHPVGHVLPVAVGEVDYDALPPYLGAVTVFRPSGDLVAELIALISRQQRRRLYHRLLGSAAAAAALAVVAVGWWWSIGPGGGSPPAPAPAPALASASASASAPVVASEAPPVAQANAEPVRLVGMLGNTGWTITLDLVGAPRPREIFFRWAGEPEFRSTGFAQMRDAQTGLPKPNLHFEAEVDIAAPLAPRTLELRYDDAAGRRHGPFVLTFDPQAQAVAWTRQVLETTAGSWLAFREYPAGHRLVYFTHLISYKNGLRQIRYSIDDASLSRSVRFKPDWTGPGAPRITEGDQIMVEIPLTARFVEVQLVLADGTVWPPRRFPVRPG